MKERTLSARERNTLARVNPALADYVDEIAGDWNARLSALQKVARMLKAEREALQELAVTGLLRQGVANLAELRTALDVNEARMDALAGDNDRLRKQLMEATAAPAMAVYGE